MSNKIIPKTALIEIDGAIDDFYDEWEDNGDNIGVLPTQEDYDKWLFSTAMGFFERHRYGLHNYLKLKENQK